MSKTPTAAELFDLTGTVAVVTGAAGGIGLAAVEVLASAGAVVVLSDLAAADPVGVAATLTARGLPVEGVVCDVTQQADLDALVSGIIDRHGRVDTVFANAGVSLEDHPNGMDPDQQFDAMFDINVRSVLRLAERVIPHLADGGGGAFVIMSSLAALRGNATIKLYGLTKAANAQLARNLAVEWGPRGVRVNALAPGVIRTEFAKAITEGPRRDDRIAKTPMRTFGEPYHVAGTVLWLASKAGSFTSGQTIVVDGGTMISD